MQTYRELSLWPIYGVEKDQTIVCPSPDKERFGIVTKSAFSHDKRMVRSAVFILKGKVFLVVS